MFLLTYYDEKDCLITILEHPFSKKKKAQQAMSRTVLRRLKQYGCKNPEALFQKAQKKPDFFLIQTAA